MNNSPIKLEALILGKSEPTESKGVIRTRPASTAVRTIKLRQNANERYNWEFDRSSSGPDFCLSAKSEFTPPVAIEPKPPKLVHNPLSLARLTSARNPPIVFESNLKRLMKEMGISAPNPYQECIASSAPPYARLRSSTIKRNLTKKLKSPDYDRIDMHLTTLSDYDGKREPMLNAATHLLKMSSSETEPPMYWAYYDAGMLTVLSSLLSHHGLWPEVQATCCLLIKYIISNLESAQKQFIKMDGFAILLNVAAVSAKGFLELKDRDRKGDGGAMARLGAKIKVNDASIEALDPNTSFEKVDNIAANQASFKSTSCTKDSLQESILAKYFREEYFEKYEVMDKIQKKDEIQRLLNLMVKIDQLFEITEPTLLNADFDEMVSKITSGLQRILHCDAVSLYTVDIDTFEISKHSEDKKKITKKFQPGTGIVGLAIQTKEIVTVKDATQNKIFHQDLDGEEDHDSHTMLVVPIIASSNKVIAALKAQGKLNEKGEESYFDEEDEFFVKYVADFFRIFAENHSLYQGMSSTQKKIEVLLNTTKQLGSAVQIDVLIKMIMDSAKDLLGADRCTIFLDDKERKRLRALVQGRSSVQSIAIPYTAGIAGAVFSSGEAVNIHDAYLDSRFNAEVDKQTGYRTKTILCMPIKNIHGESIGVTQMINKKRGMFTSEDEHILNSFSAQAAVSLEKTQLFQRTEDMRLYLQSILSSIPSCVITLSEHMKLATINRSWFIECLGLTESFCRENSIEKWLGDNNSVMYNDICQVYESGKSLFSSEYELKVPKFNRTIHYHITPFAGTTKGVVLVLDDISAEKRAVTTLQRYMSPALAKQVMEESTGELGGTRKKVSILFSDIRSFTTLSEGMEPTDVVELLNHHFTDAVNAITEEQGILDKFIGDAVMAVFGVPFISQEDAIHACNTALKMREALIVTNKFRESSGKLGIKIGIGVNTGMVLSGNIGSKARMEFSCIGDAVNLASRIEGLTKFYGVQILISEFTLADTGDAFLVREVDSVVVSGKKNAVRVYELLGKKGDILAREVREVSSLYTNALGFYRARNFSQAMDLFQSCIKLHFDGPSKVLLERCKKYIYAPPPQDWDGCFISTEK